SPADYRPGTEPHRAAGRVSSRGEWCTPHGFAGCVRDPPLDTGSSSRTLTCHSPFVARAGDLPLLPGRVTGESPTPCARRTRGSIWEVRTCPGRPRPPPRCAVGRPGPVPTAGWY